MPPPKLPAGNLAEELGSEDADRGHDLGLARPTAPLSTNDRWIWPGFIPGVCRCSSETTNVHIGFALAPALRWKRTTAPRS